MSQADKFILTVSNAAYFTVGYRIHIGPRRSWPVRVWRWLAKQNQRIARIDDGTTITLERCR